MQRAELYACLGEAQEPTGVVYTKKSAGDYSPTRSKHLAN
jgi:hypothetical protein